MSVSGAVLYARPGSINPTSTLVAHLAIGWPDRGRSPRDREEVLRMESPPNGGERDSRKKTVKKVIGWLALQAFGAWLRRQIENLL